LYSLHVTCATDEAEALSVELWEAGTCGIRELDLPDGRVKLIAAFEQNEIRKHLLDKFERYSPEWLVEDERDWVAETRQSWPARAIGERLFLAPVWCEDATPVGRIRLIHNPGLACGTGQHPCTQLALQALETTVQSGHAIADIGTGSGILAIAALQLGARLAVGVDLDQAALSSARENFLLNHLRPTLVAGSADCLGSESADVIVANISPSVLLALADDLLRVVRPGGCLILTGFQDREGKTIAAVFAPLATFSAEGWSCLISRAF
jgi:ribosomal protein L11 methyltransferase